MAPLNVAARCVHVFREINDELAAPVPPLAPL
jgi:hypothetical protein